MHARALADECVYVCILAIVLHHRNIITKAHSMPPHPVRYYGKQTVAEHHVKQGAATNIAKDFYVPGQVIETIASHTCANVLHYSQKGGVTNYEAKMEIQGIPWYKRDPSFSYEYNHYRYFGSNYSYLCFLLCSGGNLYVDSGD